MILFFLDKQNKVEEILTDLDGSLKTAKENICSKDQTFVLSLQKINKTTGNNAKKSNWDWIIIFLKFNIMN